MGRPVAHAINLFVAELIAPGTRFNVMRRSSASAIADLRDSMEVRERARQSNVIEVAFTGTDRAQVAAVLNEVLNAYVRQNVEYRSAEAESTLKFLELQLPSSSASSTPPRPPTTTTARPAAPST